MASLKKNSLAWRYHEIDIKAAERLKDSLSVSFTTACVLANRGVRTVDEAVTFLNPSLDRLPPPSLMQDLGKGAERIVQAIKNDEVIAVYGDYDADGITACALLVMFLKRIGARVEHYLPDRIDEGYSLNEKALAELRSRGASLVVTVDCGVSDSEHVQYGRSIGLDIVITDHHLPTGILPDACAVINPRRSDCDFPFKELAGVGVAFYLLIELRTQLRAAGVFSGREEPNLREYLDLVAIGTVADSVPLTGPNRIFVKYGLEEMGKSRKEGIRSLSAGNAGDVLDARFISHRIAPRINAPGRMGSPLRSLELLMATDSESADRLLKVLNEENNRRQEQEKKILQNVREMLEEMDDRLCYVLYSPDWHQGVIGIVASKLLDEYGRPFILLTDEGNGMLRGSARSTEDFNIKEVFDTLSHMIEDYGGHAMAAGLSIRAERLNEFTTGVEAAAEAFLDGGEFRKYHRIDCELSVGAMNDQLLVELDRLAPFGKGNEEPVFVIKNVMVENARAVGSRKNHLKLNLSKDGICFPAIGFFMYDDAIDGRTSLDIAGVPKLNEYNGRKEIDFHLRDICIHEE